MTEWRASPRLGNSIAPSCLELDRDANATRNVKVQGTAFVEGRVVGSPGKREAPPLAQAR